MNFEPNKKIGGLFFKKPKFWFYQKNAFLQTSTKFFHRNLLVCQTMSPTLHGSIIFKKYFSYTYKERYLKMW